MGNKDYVKNAKAGDVLNESALKDFKDQSNSRKSTLVEFDGIDYKIEIIGTISNMKYSKNFEDQVLEFMKDIKNDVKDIKSRLDVVEKDTKDIKSRLDVLESLPTIQNELSELPKNKN